MAPEDLMKLARFLGMSTAEAFKRYLILDYVLVSGQKRYYACPARVGDQPGGIVSSDWTFSDSPCIFLSDNSCKIEQAKPRGGKSFSCFLMTGKRNRLGFGKRGAAEAWGRSQLLRELLRLVGACEVS